MAQARIGRGFSGIFTRAGERGRGRSFVMIGLEGIAVALLGLYMILVPDTARDNIRTIAGLALIVSGLYQLQRGFSFYAANTHRNVVPLRFIGGSVMLFGGIMVAIEKLTIHFNADAARIVLAGALLAAGVFGIGAGLLGRREGDLKLGNIIASVALIVLAGFLISEVRSGENRTQLLGVIVLLLGLALLAYAYLLRQRGLDATPAPVAETTYYPSHAIEPEPTPAPADPVNETTPIRMDDSTGDDEPNQ